MRRGFLVVLKGTLRPQRLCGTKQEIELKTMETMKKTIILFLLLGIALPSLFSQEIRIPPKLFTLRNARLAIGMGAEANFSDGDDQGESYTHFYLGSNDAVKFRYNANDLPYWSAGLVLDLYAPNSIMSLYAEANYANYTFNVLSDDLTDRFQLTTYEFPVFLKIRLGKVHAKNHFLMMPGIAYNVIGEYKHESAFETIEDKEAIENYFSLQAIVGFEYGFGDDDSPNVRSMLYLKGIYRPEDIFVNDELSSGQEFDFSDVNIALGFKFFFKLGKD